MEVIVRGVEYKLRNYSNKDTYQGIRFVQKTGDHFLDGITNEEVLYMMIDRLSHLNRLHYSSLNQRALDSLKDALKYLKERQKNKYMNKDKSDIKGAVTQIQENNIITSAHFNSENEE